MLVRCINRGFLDLEADTFRNVGDEWDATEKRLKAINAAGYGQMAVAVAPAEAREEAPAETRADYSKMTKAELLDAAEEAGISVPPRATKAEIAALLEA